MNNEISFGELKTIIGVFSTYQIHSDVHKILQLKTDLIEYAIQVISLPPLFIGYAGHFMNLII